MRWSFKIARVADIEVRLHLTFLLLLAWIGLSYYAVDGLNGVARGLPFVILLFGCVLLHEFGHALAARRFGIRTADITLLPIGGVARLRRMPDDPRQEIAVALAGPLVNAVIAAMLVGFGATEVQDVFRAVVDPNAPLAPRLAAANLSLLLFNLVPAFPMDGGRVLRALLAFLLPYARATRLAARVGQVCAVGFGFAGLTGNPLLLLIAFYIYLCAEQEATMAEWRSAAANLRVADAMVTHLWRLPADATLDDAVQALVRTSHRELPVVDPEDKLLGVLWRGDAIAGLQRHGSEIPVTRCMRRGRPTVRPGDSLASAFQTMQESESPALAVVEDDGRFAGMVTLENAAELSFLRSAGLDGSRRSLRLGAA